MLGAGTAAKVCREAIAGRGRREEVVFGAVGYTKDLRVREKRSRPTPEERLSQPWPALGP